MTAVPPATNYIIPGTSKTATTGAISTAAEVGIGVGAGVGGLALITLGVLLTFRWHKKKVNSRRMSPPR